MAKGTFARMADILKSNINELLDRAEDPEKMIRQMVREMEEAVNKATASVGTAVANNKRLERQHNERAATAKEWQGERSTAAMTSWRDALSSARRCCRKRLTIWRRRWRRAGRRRISCASNFES